MAIELPVSGVIPISEMKGDDEEETLKLRQMETEARDFISDFEWCKGIREFYFGEGVGGVMAIFFTRIDPARPSVDEFLWIVVGDLPPAYIVPDASPTPKEALEAYIAEMREWVALAKQGRTSEDVIPVNVPATREGAETLESRLDTLEQKIIPIWFS